MCKIAVICNITDETSENAMKFIKKMSKEMSWSEKDGFGYAAINSEGKLFGERWKNPSDCFVSNKLIEERSKQVVSRFKGMLKPKDKPTLYNSFGELTTLPLRSAILHARTATAPNTMENTHPFVNNDTCLVHNGVIRNTEELVMKISTCDSETILNEYIKQGVGADLNKIQEMAWNLQGYYACGVYSKDANGRWVLDVFKDKTARLAGYYIEELKSIVIATPGYSTTYSGGDGYGPVSSACRDLGFTVTETYEIADSSVVRLDAMTGEVIDQLIFDSVYKDRKKKNKHKGNGGNNGSGGAHSYPDHEYGDAAERWNSMFAGHGNDARHKRTNWSEKQKDEDLDRMLTEVVSGDAASPTSCNLPAIPSNLQTAQEVAEAFEHDFIEDEVGVWHRKGTGTDRQ